MKEYNEGSNLYNRAIQGTYVPGSTFKMVVATAALETQTITTATKINDTGIYPRGHNPRCWIYSSKHYGHGYLNITGAIAKSCNYFFYETGYKMGIEPVIQYAKMYGLGTKTGIELSGEETGIVDLKSYCEQTENRSWSLGDTLSAVIGQSYNSYTPIQMAKYISTIANGGTPVDVTLIKSITSVDGKQIAKSEIENKVNEKLGIQTNKSQEKLNIKPETIKTLQEGMKGVTSQPRWNSLLHFFRPGNGHCRKNRFCRNQ